MIQFLAYRIRLVFTLAIALCLSGCFVTSDNPILPEGASGIDPALYGAWYGSLHPDDDPFYLHIVPYTGGPGLPDAATESSMESSGGMTLLLAFHEPPRTETQDGAADGTLAEQTSSGTDSGWGLAKAYAATVNGAHFLSVRFDFLGGSDRDEMGDYHLYLYKFDPSGQLILERLSDDTLIDLIDKGELAGTVSGDTKFRDGHLTASSEELVALLASKDPTTLVEPKAGIFQRLQP